MAYDADKIIDVATRLKAAKERVVELEGELRRLVLSQTTAVNLTQSISTASRVMGLLNSDPGKDFSAADVWKKLNLKESYVRPLLSRLVKDGKVEKRSRGAYGALGGAKQKSLESLDSRPVSVNN